MTTAHYLLAAIDSYLSASSMDATTFGQKALGEPAFVLRLRNGEDIAGDTAMRVYAFMQGGLVISSGNREWNEAETFRLLSIIADGGSYKDAAIEIGGKLSALRMAAKRFADKHAPNRPRNARLAPLFQSILQSRLEVTGVRTAA